MRNAYEGLLEPWKVKLIADRARYRGLADWEIEDLTQDIAPALARFQYDPDNPNGASERTALLSVVDKQIAFHRRTHARYRQVLDRYQSHQVATRSQNDRNSLCQMLSCCELRLEIQEVFQHLSKVERAICMALAMGVGTLEIAKQLRLTQYQVKKVILRLRTVFRQHGLEA